MAINKQRHSSRLHSLGNDLAIVQVGNIRGLRLPISSTAMFDACVVDLARIIDNELAPQGVGFHIQNL
jgi:hypothetical protein